MELDDLKHHKDYLAGLILGFAAVSLLTYYLEGVLPDLVSTVTFAAVFSVVWFGLEKISLFD